MLLRSNYDSYLEEIRKEPDKADIKLILADRLDEDGFENVAKMIRWFAKYKKWFLVDKATIYLFYYCHKDEEDVYCVHKAIIDLVTKIPNIIKHQDFGNTRFGLLYNYIKGENELTLLQIIFEHLIGYIEFLGIFL